MELRFYLALLVRRLPLVFLFVFLGGAIGVTLAFLLPSSYSAEARLVAESEQIPSDLAASTVQVDPREQLEIIEQRILARDVLIEMANRLGIYAEAEARTGRMSADDKVSDLRERITFDVTGGRTNRGPAEATLVTIGFRAPTGDMAAAVTNELVTLLLNENASMRRETASETLEFFIQEVDRLDSELANRGAALQAFQEANREALPESLEFRRGQLLDAQARILQLSRDEAMLKDRRARLVQLYEETGGVGLSMDGAPQTPEERQLAQLQSELAGMLAIMSPSNPRVIALRGQIAAVEQQVMTARGAGVTGSDPSLSAYQLQLSDIDGQIAYIEEQRTTLQATVDELIVTIQATPGNAIALDELQRNYDNVRAQYDDAVARRAAAATGEMIESLNRGQRISQIESATVPRHPDSPNRPLLAAAGVGGGLVLGLAIAAALELLNRSIRRPVDLTNGLGITPFAALPLIQSAREVNRRRMRIVAAFAIALIGLPATIWAVHTQVMPIDQVVDLILQRLA